MAELWNSCWSMVILTNVIAGLIALAVFIVQIFLSLAWSLLLVALLTDSETAVTWSVVSRILHTSFWPNILRTDAIASKGVRTPITVVTWSVILTTLLVTVAAIVTPLGLYDTVTQSNDPTLVPFQYVRDGSPFGAETAQRPALGFSRICLSGERVCPNDANREYNVTYQKVQINSTDSYLRRIDNVKTYDTRIPSRLWHYFSSGLPRLGPTVSGPFDIQWRIWRLMNNTQHAGYNNNTGLVFGDYRHVSSVILKDSFEVVEGLVADSKLGGIGFRNHSIPVSNVLEGAVWTEDLLFLEPVTKCVNMNLTLEYTLKTPSLQNITIVDNGGFVNIDRSTPYWRGSNDQEDPQLADRAYIAAWKTKMLTMFLLNITNTNNGPDKLQSPPFSYLKSRVGDKFNLPDQSSTDSPISHNNLRVQLHGGWLADALEAYTWNSVSKGRLIPDAPSNPWNVTKGDYLEISNECDRASFTNSSGGSVVAGMCGNVLGVPVRKDNLSSILSEDGSQWSAPIYSCASANRAIIKSVRFAFNSSRTLEGLKVLDIKPKQYNSASEHPLWAFETVSGSSNERWPLARWTPLWGIVDKEDTGFTNLTYKRSPELWLNGDASLARIDYQDFNLPAAEAPKSFLFHAYSTLDDSAIGKPPVADYSGRKNAPLLNLWRHLSQSAEQSERIINLIWTDVATNALVGTRGQIPSSEPRNLAGKEDSIKNAQEAQVQVYLRDRATAYHLVYGIPGFILLAFVALMLIACVISFVSGRGTIRRVKFYLSRLSTGRVMTAFLEDDAVSQTSSIKSGSSTSRWLRKRGRMLVDVSGNVPKVSGHASGEASEAMLKSGPAT